MCYNYFKIFFTGEASEDGPDRNGKGILMFSTPHSGKTTLLQGIMNFVFGVSSTDNFRLCFEQDLKRKVKQLNISKTVEYVLYIMYVVLQLLPILKNAAYPSSINQVLKIHYLLMLSLYTLRT